MSSVPRFFVASGTVTEPRFLLPGELEHQVRRVLRVPDGGELILLEGDGHEVRCRLAGAWCEVLERHPSTAEPRHRLTIWQALLKSDHLEQVIQHATEVGVAAFRLVLTERCVARDLSGRRLERLRTIAREAAEQSERGVVPPVEAPVPLTRVAWSESVLLFERHHGVGLKRVSQDAPPVGLVIGPEGGFTRDEVRTAVTRGARLAGLGPRILRSETVAVAAAAVVLAASGDFA
jgi:16S rRNA (uracil1498-N3)-methyltransferase